MKDIDLNEIRTENDALDQSIALGKIVMQVLEHQRENNRRLFIALVISLVINLLIVAGFLWYELQWEYTATVTEVTQTVEGEGNDINNVQGNQYNDSATHNEGVD